MVYSGPRKIKVGTNIITIKNHKFKGSEYADFDPWLYEMRISKDKMCASVIRQTVLHEIIHAIEKSNVAIKSLNEQQVEQLATGIYGVLRDNKKLVRWLLK